MAITFQEHRTSSLDLTIIQQNISALTEAIGKIELIGGKLIGGLELSATPLAVEHGLGRAYNGFIVTDADSNKTVYNSKDSADTSLFINLRVASGTNNVSVWVF